ncbi:MAG: helix-turn-helix transcriptional regulator [Proteobacteria bacterium]|nr:XRE family transcriptional regulator [Pseudomonadota bacterium]NOG59611.1 helix-turn-helix transcriptional regulator [Pseudomonadota bacterium]
MKANKEKKLKDAGWKIGSTNEFLELTPEESAYIEMKLALCNSLKEKRIKKRISQVAFAKKIASSQSRVAKMEAGDPSVSIDLIMKSLLTLGISKKELAQVISTSK